MLKKLYRIIHKFLWVKINTKILKNEIEEYRKAGYDYVEIISKQDECSKSEVEEQINEYNEKTRKIKEKYDRLYKKVFPWDKKGCNSE